MTMTIDKLQLLEDALEMQGRMTKEQFIACVKPAFRESNARGWDEALALVKTHGTRLKALNWIEREIDAARDAFFPA